MALVTSDEVKAVIDTNRDVSSFIDSAHLIVTEDLADADLSDDRLKQIELYLAAHFVALTEERGGLVKSKHGDASEEYQFEKGRGIAMTRYGQTAIDLDTSGTLRTMARSANNAEFRVV